MKREEEKMDKKSLENLLKSRALENMSDEEKVAINHASFELLQEQHERVSSLIERVADSLNGDVVDYTIGTVLLDREEVRLYEKEISPMFLSDLNKKVSKILFDENTEEERVYKTIFLDMPYEKLKKIDEEKIDGEAIDEFGNKYKVGFRLVKEEKYIKKLKEMSEVIQRNNIKWENIYCPFAYKAFSLIVEDFSESINNIENFDKVTIKVNFPEEIRKSMIEKILCWNINEETEYPEILVRPSEEQIYYEHILEERDENVLVEKSTRNFEFLYRDGEFIKIVTSNIKYERLKLYFIKNIDFNFAKKVRLYGNIKKYNRQNNQNTEMVLILRSIAEMNNVLQQYEVFDDYSIEGFSDKNSKIIETYDLQIKNRDEFLLKNKRKRLYLRLKYVKSKYSSDIISFMKGVLEEYLVDCDCIFTEF